jgi:hypothetical protein
VRAKENNMTKVRLDIPHRGLAPLFRHLPDKSSPQLAFLQLDPQCGRISYGWRRDGQMPAAERENRLFRWPVHPALRGDYCMVVARVVQSLMQVVQDGYSAEVKADNGKCLLIGRLDASARAAKSTISDLLCSGLIDQDDPLHVAQVISPEDFVRERITPKGAIGPDTSDTGLAVLCRESLEVATDEGVFVDGVLIDALTAMRDEMRDTGKYRSFK